MNLPTDHRTVRSRSTGGIAGSLRARARDLVLAALCGSGLIVAWLADVADNYVHLGDHTVGVNCWSRELLDIHCPYCGMTRSVVALLDGDIAGSLTYHPGGFLIALGLLLTCAGVIAAAVLGRRPMSSSRWYWRAVEVIAVVCLIAGLKNFIAPVA